MSRRLLAAGRVLLWGAVVLVWVRGAVSLFPGAAAGSRPAEAQAARQAFPEDPARAVAARFAQEYLTYGTDGAEERTRRLAPFLRAGADPSTGWDGRGTQQVASVVPVGLSVLSPDTAVATVSARAGSRWVYLAVPMAVEGDRILVTDQPAFVAGPWPSEGLEADPITADPARSGEVAGALESFFRAYAAGSAADLSYFAAPGRSLTGLGGSVDLSAVVEVRVGEGDGPVPALVRVRWVDRATGAGLTQTYRMTLVPRDGRWYVDRLGAGPATNGKEA
ncbi:MAG: conjugal transfer protein [Actinomycetota bacterium]